MQRALTTRAVRARKEAEKEADAEEKNVIFPGSLNTIKHFKVAACKWCYQVIRVKGMNSFRYDQPRGCSCGRQGLS